MADAGSTGADDTGANNGDEDNDRIIKISNDEDLRLERLAALSHNTSNEEYTLRNKYRVIADDMKSQFRIPHNLQIHTN
jgi:hypothetical protein